MIEELIQGVNPFIRRKFPEKKFMQKGPGAFWNLAPSDSEGLNAGHFGLMRGLRIMQNQQH